LSPFTVTHKFSNVSTFDHGRRCRRGHCSIRPSALPIVSVLAGPATRQTKAMRHARISTGILGANIRDRAAALPEVPAESHAAVEARSGTDRFRLPDIRMPKMRPCRNDGCIARPDGFGRARLACERIEAADVRRGGAPVKCRGPCLKANAGYRRLKRPQRPPPPEAVSLTTSRELGEPNRRIYVAHRT
jgi:hypothetical protein